MSRTYRYDVLADLILRHAELTTRATDEALAYRPATVKKFARAEHETRREQRRTARVIVFPRKGA